MVAWADAKNGAIPANAIPVGHDATGKLFVARASIQGGGVQLGKIGASFGAALIPYGGNEVSVSHYQVLVGSNEEVANGSPAFPTAFAPFNGPVANKGPAPAPVWAPAVPPVFPPDQHARNGFVPPVFGTATSTELPQYIEGEQATPSDPVLQFSAIVCGREQNGTPLFCALVEYEGGLHPGKVRLGLGGANIGWGGVEIGPLSPYSVLCDASYGFMPSVANSGNIPAGCQVWGQDDDGSPLYFARDLSGEGLQVGKVGPNLHGASIGYAGVEQHIAPGGYWVMFQSNTINALNTSRPAANGDVPDGAVVLGCEADATPLFGGSALGFNVPNESNQLGKVRHGFGGLVVPYGGHEMTVPSYWVVCATGYTTTGWPT